MSFLTGLRCLRCGAEYPAGKLFRGCAKCRGDKVSNLTPTYDYDKIKQVFRKESLSERTPTMWRYREFLPADDENVVSIGEGMTPLVKCSSLGKKLGLGNLYVKNESCNPTWSYKDRLASSGVSMAVQFGAQVVTVSSSGNHGAATGAYAARAGLDCVIFTIAAFPMTMRTLMQSYGAKVVVAPNPRDRWTLMDACVEEFDWFPMGNFTDPAIGSNPYGVDGYKTIAFEICEQLGWRAPDKVVMPVAHGDGFYGCWKGFEEFFELGFIDSKPQMIAAEAFGPLKNALAKDLDYVEKVPSGPTVCFSVGTDQAPYQALKTLLDSDGSAEVASDEEVMRMQLELAASEGIYGEASSVLTLAVVKELRDEGKIDENETVIAVLTSSGLKDPASTHKILPEIPVVQPNVDALRAGLAQAYGYTLPGS
jgi:threonine synthase